jgi:hypothetical protein
MDPVCAAVIVQGGGTKEKTVGVAILTPRSRQARADNRSQALHLYQFIESGERFASLESVLVRHAPEHVYLADAGSEAENNKLKTLLGDDTEVEVISKAKFNDSETPAALVKLGGAVDAARVDGEDVSHDISYLALTTFRHLHCLCYRHFCLFLHFSAVQDRS